MAAGERFDSRSLADKVCAAENQDPELAVG
jgi:hypothetical protein